MKYLLFIPLLMIFPLASLAQSNCDDLGDLDSYSDSELEDLFEACEAEIEEEKKNLAEKKQVTASVSQELSVIDSQYRKSSAVVNQKQIELQKIAAAISEQKEQVKTLEEQTEISKEALSALLRQQNELDQFSPIEAVFSRNTLSGFFEDLTFFDIVKERLKASYERLITLREETLESAEELEEEEARERQLKAQKERELQAIAQNRADQKVVLAIAQQKEEQTAALIAEKESIRNQIRSRMFTVASGEEISFGDALDLIRPYEDEFAIDAAFLLAILFQESGWGGNIGGNIGQCTYKQIHSVTNQTVMSPRQHDAFETIMDGLGQDPNSQKVSCPIPRDGSYGGAMGPAQFIPTTWMSVRDRAANIIGISGDATSPFVNRDSFVASAVYLSDHYNSQSCRNYGTQYSHISPEQTLRERCAASRYYAGGNWWNFRFQYGESVVKRAERFRDDIEKLGL